MLKISRKLGTNKVTALTLRNRYRAFHNVLRDYKHL